MFVYLCVQSFLVTFTDKHVHISLEILLHLYVFNVQFHVTCLLWTVLAESHLLPLECDIAPSLIKAPRQNQPLMWVVSSIHYSFRQFLQFLWLKFKSEMEKFFSLLEKVNFPHDEGGTAESLICCSAGIEFFCRSRNPMDFHPVSDQLSVGSKKAPRFKSRPQMQWILGILEY